MHLNLENSRKSYDQHQLEEHAIPRNPFDLFASWYKDAEKISSIEANAMGLATVSSDGKPSLRKVLLKEVMDGAFVFYTNYNSRKGREIEHNPSVALLFHWEAQERQVRIEGVALKLDAFKSDEYFESRPLSSQQAAIASPQSEIIEDRDDLEQRFAKVSSDHLIRPEFWGGYGIVPKVIEFWQGRPSRMHDRIAYTKDDSMDSWSIHRLAP
jgi:pyridoxamine 5'-phosphate oxidase